MPKNSSKIFRGSVLVFALSVLSIALVIALAVAVATSIQRKTAIDTTSSVQSLQTADNASEKFNSIYAGKKPSEQVNVLASPCNAGNSAFCCNTAAGAKQGRITGVIAGDVFDLSLWGDLDADGAIDDKISCDATTELKKVLTVKGNATHKGTTRAIEFTPPCAGFNPDDMLVGHWPLTGDGNDQTALQNHAVANFTGTAPQPEFVSADNKSGIKLNMGSLAKPFKPDGDNNNYLKIPHKAAYELASGTVSFWFYVNQPSAFGNQFIFSKDVGGCSRKEPIAPGNLVTLQCNNDFSNNPDCDCGHLSFVWDYDIADELDNSGACPHKGLTGWNLNNNFATRFQNDGNGCGASYALLATAYRPADFSKKWHMTTVTFDTTGYTFFVDGKKMDKFPNPKIGNEDNNPPFEALFNNKVDIILGAYLSGITGSKPENFFRGYLNGLRIYSSKLSDCQVSRLYVETK